MARRIPKITAVYLERVTSWYLERRTTSTVRMRELLMERVHRSIAEHGIDLAEAEALVDAEMARLERTRLLDDAQFAADKARSMRSRGASTTRVRAALRAKGIASDTVEALPSEDVDPDWIAARTWARKRRIGPWRTGTADAELRSKEVAKLARAGFSWDLARRIVEATDPEALDRPGRDED